MSDRNNGHEAITRLKKSRVGQLAKALLREGRTVFNAKTLFAPRHSDAAGPSLAGTRHITRFSLPPEATLGDARAFKNWISQDAIFPEGADAFYLSPTAWRSSALAFLSKRYPHSSGLKVSKNLGDVHSHYMTSRPGRHIQRMLSGPHLEQVQTYNWLYLEGIAPRLWDIVELINPAGDIRVAYVVDHVTGAPPAPAEFEDVVGRLRSLCRQTQAVLVSGSGWRGVDFQLPDGNGNVITSDRNGRPLYVDIHSFKMTPQRLTRCASDRPPTASASPSNASEGFDTLLARHGVRLNGKLVIDASAGDSALAASCLRQGARWVHAIAAENATAELQRSLLIAGETCLSTSANRSFKSIASALPPHLASFRASEVLIRTTEDAARADPAGLATLPWRHLVLEHYSNKKMVSQVAGLGARFVGSLTVGGGAERLTLWERLNG